MSLLFIIIIIIGLVIYRIAFKKDEVEAQSIADIQKVKGVPVRVEKAIARDLTVYSIYSGTIEGSIETTIASKLNEKLADLYVSVGQYVKAGQIIARFDTFGSTSQYKQASVAYENALLNYKRMKKLLEEGAISQSTLEQTEMGLKVAEANLDVSRSLIELTAPISGIITKQFVEKGELLYPGAPIVTIAQTGQVKLILKISETEIANIKIGQKAKVEVSTYPNKIFEGKVYKIAPAANPENRKFKTEILLNNTDGLLKSGMFAKANIEIAYKEQVLSVLREAIIKSDEADIIYLAIDNKAEKRNLILGIHNTKYYEVLEGLNKNDLVIIDGFDNLIGGEKLNIIQPQ